MTPLSLPLTWDDLAAGFLDRCRERFAAVRTLEAYQEDLETFAAWHARRAAGAAPSPAAVKPADVADYRRWLADRCKPATVNRRVGTLRTLFAWAVHEGHLARNPAEHVRPIPQVRLGPRSLDRHQVDRLLEAARRAGARDALLITVLVQTGLRISEALGLTWAEVRLGDGSGAVVVRHGKGGKYREVPLNRTARQALAAWRQLHWADAPPARAPVFPGPKGAALSRRAAEEALVRYSRAAGLEPPATPHALRHTFCKELVDAGESLDRVAALAGHASLDTTARYTRPTREDLERAVARLESLP